MDTTITVTVNGLTGQSAQSQAWYDRLERAVEAVGGEIASDVEHDGAGPEIIAVNVPDEADPLARVTVEAIIEDGVESGILMA